MQSRVVVLGLLCGMWAVALVAQGPIVLPANGVKKPKLMHNPDPPNPPGTYYDVDQRVVLRYVVDVDGSVHDAQVVKSGGGKYDKVALRFVQGYQYRPATKDGVPVAVVVKKTLNFDHVHSFDTYPGRN